MGWNASIFTKGYVRGMKAGEKARDRQRREREEGSAATRPHDDDTFDRRTSNETSHGPSEQPEP